MRNLIILAALGLATPAAAQNYRDLALPQDAAREAEAQALRNRDIAITNELSTLQARVQSEQALSDLAAMRARPTLPAILIGPHTPVPKVDPGQFATIPDATLAQSNERVRAAAGNHR